jgi:4-hydroxy-tetrahydrodipicolinate synthase
MVALVTPMDENGAVNVANLRELVEFHLAEGTDAIVAVGTTGESATLDEAEHLEVIRLVIEHVRGRVPVIAGTGSNSTAEALSLTRQAKDLGADACLLVSPYYNRPTQEGLYLHHKTIAEAVEIPQILYNVPGRTACDLLPETAARLSRVPNIIGIKDATGKLERLDQTRQLSAPGFLQFSGDDATGCEFCLLGGNGVISVTANLAPRKMHAMWLAASSGQAELARSIDALLSGLHRELFIEPNPIPAKWALWKLGLIPGGIRLPLTWLSPQYEAPLLAALGQAELI